LTHRSRSSPVTQFLNCMQAYNEKPLFSLPEKEILEKMTFHHTWGLLADCGADAGDCTECAACEEACTQHLNIIQRLKEMDAWEKTLKKE